MWIVQQNLMFNYYCLKSSLMLCREVLTSDDNILKYRPTQNRHNISIGKTAENTGVMPVQGLTSFSSSRCRPSGQKSPKRYAQTSM